MGAKPEAPARMPALDARSIDEIMDYGPDEPPS
jgi:hypothetical protein